MTKLTIAIDGYSSCGKSTFAKAIAKQLQYIYIDTGAMYRCVALFALQNNCTEGNNVNSNKLQLIIDQVSITFKKNPTTDNNDAYLNNINVEPEIRGLQVANMVSAVSQLNFVRERMVEQQRNMGNQGGVVLDGRDIGTVVFPNAQIKIFMTAHPEVRALRRYNELKAKGENVSIDDIAQNLKQRDFIDSTRKESPLMQADDAVVLDNSTMTPEQQLTWFNAIYQRVINYNI